MSRNPFINFTLASSRSAAPRMILITRSMSAKHLCKPSKICSRSLARSKSYLVRRKTTCLRWSMKYCRISTSESTLGWRPSTKASIFRWNDFWRSENLYRRFKIFWGWASLCKSNTTRNPSLSDSSRMSLTPSIFLSCTSLANCSTSEALFTW